LKAFDGRTTTLQAMIAFDVNDAAARDAFLRDSLPQALDSLTAHTPPRWGTMTAQQMVEHLLWAFECSTGRVLVNCPFEPAQLERIRQFLYNNRPMTREFMNPLLVAGLPALRHADLAAAKAALTAEVGLFLQEEGTHPDTVRTHPVFGPLNGEAWSRSHFKHCFHHLLQFGLVESPE
jgi:oxepin-CoA hydrolase/3-oxo-5,6-dehydrosuberyl-CoA semialdehyde dehydrogenase